MLPNSAKIEYVTLKQKIFMQETYLVEPTKLC